jgi:uncharacterized protein
VGTVSNGSTSEGKDAMTIIDALLKQIPPGEIAVRNALVGVHWTAVCSRSCGLASTLVGDSPHGHDPVRDVGSLHKKSAQELAGWLHSDNQLEASIGMAALNSLLVVDESHAVEINAAEVLAREGKGKKMAIVGHFPFIERLRPLTSALWVIEKRPHPGDFPEQAAGDYLPQADVIAISGTTLINHTLEPLLALCSSASLVMVLGPSTPLSPVLFDYGVDLISGAKVIDETAVIQTVQQGASFPQVKGVRLLTLAAPTIKD